jgi:hypothetical protein
MEDVVVRRRRVLLQLASELDLWRLRLAQTTRVRGVPEAAPFTHEEELSLRAVDDLIARYNSL